MRATTVLLTGMSGVGKSTALVGLADCGWGTVDADEAVLVDEHADRTALRLAELRAVLGQAPAGRPFAVAATGEGQGELYPLVDHVVLLTAPWPVLADRLVARTGNDFGKGPGEADRVRADQEAYEPLIRAGADLVLDTSALTPDEVVGRIAALAPAAEPTRPSAGAAR